MPYFRQSLTLELIRHIKAFLNLEMGVTRGQKSESAARVDKQKLQNMYRQINSLTSEIARTRQQLGQTQQRLDQARQQQIDTPQQLASKNRAVSNQNQELEQVRQRQKSLEREAYYELINDFHERALKLGYGDLSRYRWYHTIDLGNGLVTPGLYDHRPNLPIFKFPSDMEGMNVLDVGSATGFFAFEFEKRGANVTSVELPFGMPADKFPGENAQQTRKRVEREYRRLEEQRSSQGADSAKERLQLLQTGTPEEQYHFHNDGPFKFCHNVLNSKIQRCYSSIYDLSKENLGRDAFDLVFLGDILIHTIDPLKALAAVTPLCRGTLVISQDLPDGPYPTMTYIGGDKAGEDKSSWWKPNRLCFEQMLKKLEFKEVEVVGEHTGCIRPDMAPYKRSIIHAMK